MSCVSLLSRPTSRILMLLLCFCCSSFANDDDDLQKVSRIGAEQNELGRSSIGRLLDGRKSL